MCGRATLSTPPEDLRELFGLDDTPEIPARYNIAPTQPIAVVRTLAEKGAPARRLELLRWGLVAAGSAGPAAGPPLINARAESLASWPAVRESFRARRCLIVVDGFFEWRHEGRTKQPYLVHRVDRKAFALAGLWDRWVSKDGEVIESCAVVTCKAVAPVDQIHDRMPVIVAPADYARWLDPNAQDTRELGALVRPPATGELVLLAVSTRVNSAANDDAECIAPAKELTLF